MTRKACQAHSQELVLSCCLCYLFAHWKFCSSTEVSSSTFPFSVASKICRLPFNALNQVRQLPVLWVAFQKNQGTGWNSTPLPPLEDEPQVVHLKSGHAGHSKSLLSPSILSDSRHPDYASSVSTPSEAGQKPLPQAAHCSIECMPHPFLSWVNHNLGHSFRRRQWHPTPGLVPGESRGRRSLVGYSPWGR